mmetsp:Transcript_23379/g.41485  ORF Transcript_23379/g.41485 Transcript_23379/m.41485 type:complete len:170 (-) Transcript_23379:65-574(-)
MRRFQQFPLRLWKPIHDSITPGSPVSDVSFELHDLRYYNRNSMQENNPVLIESPTFSKRKRILRRKEDVTACLFDIIKSRVESRTPTSTMKYERSLPRIRVKRKPPGVELRVRPLLRSRSPNKEDTPELIKSISKSVEAPRTLPRSESPSKFIRVRLPKAVPELPLLGH